MPENNIFPSSRSQGREESASSPGRAIDPATGRITEVDPLSLQESMSEALGNYVVVEFLIGTENLVVREGILNSVGQSWLVLYDPPTDTSTLCDMYSVKFVTFFQPGVYPYQNGSVAIQSTPQNPARRTLSSSNTNNTFYQR